MTDLSKGDLKRNDMYKQNARRAEMQASFANYKDYLLSLKMTAAIRPFESLYMSRIAQLTNKSNQFNLTTKRFVLEFTWANTPYGRGRGSAALPAKFDDSFTGDATAGGGMR